MIANTFTLNSYNIPMSTNIKISEVLYIAFRDICGWCWAPKSINQKEITFIVWIVPMHWSCDTLKEKHRIHRAKFKYSLPLCCGHTMWLVPKLVAKCASICVTKVAITDSPPEVVYTHFYLSFICWCTFNKTYFIICAVGWLQLWLCDWEKLLGNTVFANALLVGVFQNGWCLSVDGSYLKNSVRYSKWCIT